MKRSLVQELIEKDIEERITIVTNKAKMQEIFFLYTVYVCKIVK
jgi:hypothetical protein